MLFYAECDFASSSRMLPQYKLSKIDFDETIQIVRLWPLVDTNCHFAANFSFESRFERISAKYRATLVLKPTKHRSELSWQ